MSRQVPGDRPQSVLQPPPDGGGQWAGLGVAPHQAHPQDVRLRPRHGHCGVLPLRGQSLTVRHQLISNV